jgi:hypothetical protein
MENSRCVSTCSIVYPWFQRILHDEIGKSDIQFLLLRAYRDCSLIFFFALRDKRGCIDFEFKISGIFKNLSLSLTVIMTTNTNFLFYQFMRSPKDYVFSTSQKREQVPIWKDPENIVFVRKTPFPAPLRIGCLDPHGGM